MSSLRGASALHAALAPVGRLPRRGGVSVMFVQQSRGWNHTSRCAFAVGPSNLRVTDLVKTIQSSKNAIGSRRINGHLERFGMLP